MINPKALTSKILKIAKIQLKKKIAPKWQLKTQVAAPLGYSRNHLFRSIVVRDSKRGTGIQLMSKKPYALFQATMRIRHVPFQVVGKQGFQHFDYGRGKGRLRNKYARGYYHQAIKRKTPRFIWDYPQIGWKEAQGDNLMKNLFKL